MAKPLAPAPLPHRHVVRADDMVNIATALGVLGKDKRLGAEHVTSDLNYEELSELWRGNGVAARVVETHPDQMVRPGFGIRVPGDKDAADALIAWHEQVHTIEKLHEAMCAANGLGGSVLYLGAEDGQDAGEALNEEGIKTFEWLSVLTAEELKPLTFYGDPSKANYGEPETYQLRRQPRGVAKAERRAKRLIIHESRLIRFDGVKLTRKQMRDGDGWGDSVLIRCNERIRDFYSGWQTLSLLMQDFGYAELKLKGLAELILNGNRTVVEDRARMIEHGRSAARVLILDSEEEFSRKSTDLTGLINALSEMAKMLAAEIGMPVTLLMGQSPSGLNATGDTELRWFFANVDFRRTHVLKPALQRITRLAMLAADGPLAGAEEPDNWSIHLPPLWAPSEAEAATIRLTQAQVDEKEVAMGAISGQEVALSRHGGDEWSATTSIDLDRAEADVRDPLATEAPESEATPVVGAETTPVEPGTTPAAAAGAAAATGEAAAADTALNGAQVTAASEVVAQVARKELPRESGIAMLIAFFNLTPEVAERVMGPVGRTFFAEAAPAPGAPPAPPAGEGDQGEDGQE